MNRQSLLLWMLIAVLALILACGAPTPTPPSTPPLAALTPAPDSQAIREEEREGGTFVGLFSDPITLDPHLATDVISNTILVEVFGGLVTIDSQLNIVPDLAEKWVESEDGRIYTFHLRKNASFHNGKPVTAHDFKWSLERAADPRIESTPVNTYLGDIVGVREKLSGEATEIEGVRVIDDHILEITIDVPKAYFLAKLSYPTGFVLDRENAEGNRQWTREPNGTGPFKLSKYVPGEELVLTRNENYHLGPPKLDNVRLILSGATPMGRPLQMYEADEIHITDIGTLDLDIVLDPNHPLHAELHQAPPSFEIQYIGLNVKEPPFDDPKVRQAFNYALDRATLARVLLADLAVPAKGILPPGFPGHNPDLAGYEFNPEKARRLLQESNYGEALEKGDFPRVLFTAFDRFGAEVFAERKCGGKT